MTTTSPRRPSTAARAALALGALSAALLLGPIAVHAAAGTGAATTASGHGHYDGCVAPDWPVPGQAPICPPPPRP
ncbi:hypothetical protein BFL36_07485 [Clavibacter michiganensis]|uniref:Uncharacterized protein n=1 Tax=Clavibacter michiganensis TaxID=28447 RepID=A0A251YI92_9MICO|nr:hypothetical protein [Clavibacter michiganensis]OUE23883.1 hypothetical protein BFL36_07485 [Clavibacter michiganensis]